MICWCQEKSEHDSDGGALCETQTTLGTELLCTILNQIKFSQGKNMILIEMETATSDS